MYLEELVEVAIGLVLVYMVMSITVSAIQEWFSGLFKKRANNLEAILRTMLAESSHPALGSSKKSLLKKPQNDASGAGFDFTRRLYQHPLIKTLAKVGELPSYIPADKFALALFDTVMTAGTDASIIKKSLEDLKKQLPATLRSTVETGIDELIDQAKAVGDNLDLLSKLRQRIDELAAKYPDIPIQSTLDSILQSYLPVDQKAVIDTIKRGAANLVLENPQLKQAIDSLVAQAEMAAKRGENVIALARANAEKWFNDTMDRASGWYKRSAQNWSLLIGLVVAVLFNVDTFTITTQLWREPLLRQSLVAAAEKWEPVATDAGGTETPASPKETVQKMQETFTELKLPVGWISIPDFDPKTSYCSGLPLNLPFLEGKKHVRGVAFGSSCFKLGEGAPILKVLGLLVTAASTMQGAPFWFEVLQKLVNMRSAGKKPEEEKK